MLPSGYAYVNVAVSIIQESASIHVLCISRKVKSSPVKFSTSTRDFISCAVFAHENAAVGGTDAFEM